MVTPVPLALALAVLGAAACRPGPPAPETRVLWQRAYADQAQAAYGEALADARALERAVGDLVEQPRPVALEAARAAWVHARASYARTEVFRFAGGPIDAVERLVDAWPIDEGEIDYVVERPFSGMINEPALHPALSGEHLEAMNERDGETSVSTGYHAIEFLLWGQDLSAAGPGDRPHTDYLPTTLHGPRRAQYLEEATGLLVRHLEQVSLAWSPSPRSHRARFLALDPDRALVVALRGAGTFLAAELAGERLTVAYETKDQEDETSCFSDNSHNDIIQGLAGFDRLLAPGLLQVIGPVEATLAARLAAESQASLAAARAIPPPLDRAVQGDDASPGRRAILRTIQAVRAQADTVARVRDALAASRN